MKKSHSAQNLNNVKKLPKSSKEVAKKKEEEPLPKEIKLKPAIQVNSTATPAHIEVPRPQQQHQQQQKKLFQIELEYDNDEEKDDDELKEFEELEQYVEEHPSFRSTVSAVETFISTKKTDNSDKFSQMMNLFNSNTNSGKKLADLMEDEVNEGREEEILRFNEDENEIERSASSMDSGRVRNGSKVVLRKVKRIQMYDEDEDEEEEVKSDEDNYYKNNSENIRDLNLNALRNFKNGEPDIGMKKKYSCMNYEGDSDRNELDPNHDLDEDCEKVPKTSSRSSSCDKKKSKFDDANSWLDTELAKRVEIMERQSRINEDCIKSYQSLPQQQTQQQVSQLVTKLFPALKQAQNVAQQQQQSQQQKDKEVFYRILFIISQDHLVYHGFKANILNFQRS